MNIISIHEYNRNKKTYQAKIKRGAVFIYPTDTIYGIGCDAANQRAVLKVRRLKRRDTKPFSVMAPSKQWIRKNCVVSKAAEQWLKKLPAPYTLLLPLRKKSAVAKAVTNTNIIGVRIPGNWSKKIARLLNRPIVSTSANITAGKHMTSLRDLPQPLADNTDFIVYEGSKKGKPSKIVHLYCGKAIVQKR